jgi:hypothetical protein
MPHKERRNRRSRMAKLAPIKKLVGLFRVTPKIQVVSLFRVTASAAVVNHWFHHGLRLSASCHDRAPQRLISVGMRSDHGAL